jgi:hypothetical protein
MREKNDSSANHGGMRNAQMPKKEFERNEGQLNPTCGLKYATEFGNPEALDKDTKGLADFVKKHQMKY